MTATLPSRHYLLLPVVLLLLYLLPYPPSPVQHHSIDCVADTWLVGHSHSLITLSHFKAQFPNPLSHVCILFTSSHTLSSPPIFTLPISLHDAFLLAIRSNAQQIIHADDNTFFYTVHYGTGKDDVSQTSNSTISLPDLLPSPPKAGIIPGRLQTSFANPAAVLKGRPTYPAGLPVQFLAQQKSVPTIPVLRNVTLNNRDVITNYIPNIGWQRHAVFQHVTEEFSLWDIMQPEEAEQKAVKAVVLHRGVYAPFDGVVKYPKSMFWALSASDLFTKFAVQKALGGGGVVWVGGKVDVWRRKVAQVKQDLQIDEQIEKVAMVLNQSGTHGSVEDVFMNLVSNLGRAGLIEKSAVGDVRRFVQRVKRMGIVGKRGLGIGTENRTEKSAVCITGQMRSAPVTAENLRRGMSNLGEYETFVVAAKDDRVGSLRMFEPVKAAYSQSNGMHAVWIKALQNNSVIHGTMKTERQLKNYLWQLWDMRICLGLIEEREREVGRRFDLVMRARPDTVLMRPIQREWFEESVAYGRRQSYYAMNDRFFGGKRVWMGRLLSCHDVFMWVVGEGKIWHRRGGLDVHMLWKKHINSERFMARCASWKRVPMRAERGLEVRRVAWSGGVARWREFWRPKKKRYK